MKGPLKHRWLSLATIFWTGMAISLPWPGQAPLAYDGILVSDLPAGGDVTVPGQYPIRIPPRTEVLLSGMETPQSITFINKGKSRSQVQIFAQHEKKKRTITIQPGTSVVYNFKWRKPIRLKVLAGRVDALSLSPVKIQR